MILPALLLWMSTVLGEWGGLYQLCFFLGRSQVVSKEISFQLLLKDGQGSSFPDGVGRSFHQPGMVNENVMETDFEPL